MTGAGVVPADNDYSSDQPVSLPLPGAIQTEGQISGRMSHLDIVQRRKVNN
jgi:hypothetical protein